MSKRTRKETAATLNFIRDEASGDLRSPKKEALCTVFADSWQSFTL